MNIVVERFNKIKSNIASLKPTKAVNIIAVSKTFPMEHIQPLISHGHLHYGENKVQEASVKWLEQKKHNQNLRLHMVGKLQSNKAKDAVKIFDYIHSLDNQKLADALSKHQKNLNKNIEYFIQVNIGNEIQKGGIDKKNLESFVKMCLEIYNLNVIGLMCIPPNNDQHQTYFKDMRELNEKLNLKELSMGMSNDYKSAIKNGSTFVRIGSKIFGDRTN